MNFFYAHEPRWFQFDRFYKVYADDTALYGAWLAGQIYDEASSERLAASTEILAPLTVMWCKRFIRKRFEREEQYDHVDPASTGFLKMDKRNFRILRRDILGVKFKEKSRSLWVGTSISGILHVTTRMQGTRKFILVGKQDTSHILALLDGGKSL